MDDIENGGPAFPSQIAVGPSGDVYHSDGFVGMGGMSLRDWFAGQALMGLASRESGAASGATSRICYRLADAMLSARKGDPS